MESPAGLLFKSLNPNPKGLSMKTLTIAQAAKELNALAGQRLTQTPADGLLKERLLQFTNAVDAAITQHQTDIQQLRKDLELLKK